MRNCRRRPGANTCESASDSRGGAERTNVVLTLRCFTATFSQSSAHHVHGTRAAEISVRAEAGGEGSPCARQGAGESATQIRAVQKGNREERRRAQGTFERGEWVEKTSLACKKIIDKKIIDIDETRTRDPDGNRFLVYRLSCGVPGTGSSTTRPRCH